MSFLKGDAAGRPKKHDQPNMGTGTAKIHPAIQDSFFGSYAGECSLRRVIGNSEPFFRGALCELGNKKQRDSDPDLGRECGGYFPWVPNRQLQYF
ncbi:hypothetical protein [Azospirillum sp. ST 5-10]|uniref:hypothetical protein n=1 Tax=unclassified Azospirillum TaxID=2630922 RepID=UPI003F4A5D21